MPNLVNAKTRATHEVRTGRVFALAASIVIERRLASTNPAAQAAREVLELRRKLGARGIGSPLLTYLEGRMERPRA